MDVTAACMLLNFVWGKLEVSVLRMWINAAGEMKSSEVLLQIVNVIIYELSFTLLETLIHSVGLTTFYMCLLWP